jgi:prepilin-type N-terminal cleavage/methylation domain-containing protein
MSHSDKQLSEQTTSKARIGKRKTTQAGFSLIEMMVVIFVISIIMASVFRSIALTQQTSVSQQVKVDLTQQTREFMDQLTRDLRSAGYPNLRNVSAASTGAASGNCPDGSTNQLASPCNPANGVGLIKIRWDELWFAGDVDGTAVTDIAGNPTGIAKVKIIKYDLFKTGPGCPCLRRSEYLRSAFEDPVTDAGNTVATDQMENQGVQNGTQADPIFSAHDPATGAAITLPRDFTTDGTTMATINSIEVVLAVQSPRKDSTGAYPVTRVTSTINLSNCSQAWGGTRKSFAC